MSKWISTAEAARIAGVTPSSIKRWSDQDILPCEKTAGGHRRFELKVLERFLAQNTNDHPEDDFIHQWLELMLDGSHNALVGKLYQLLHHKQKWCHVADVLSPIMDTLGAQWEAGTIDIAEEHMATDTLTRALIHVGSILPQPSSNKRCLLAVVEKDNHELGLRLADLCVRAQQWHSVWLGRDTPTDVLIGRIEGDDMNVVALSASQYSTDAKQLAAVVTRVAKVCKKQGAQLVLGGSGAWPKGVEQTIRIGKFAEFDALLSKTR